MRLIDFLSTISRTLFSRFTGNLSINNKETDASVLRGVIVRRKLALLTEHQIAIVKQTVAATMTEPEQVFFRHIYDRQLIYEGGHVDHSICGQVNFGKQFCDHRGYVNFYGSFDVSGRFLLEQMDVTDLNNRKFLLCA